MAKTNFERRCEDCPNMKKVKGIMTCEECFGQKCIEIDDCPEGVTLEEIEKVEKFAKENKVKTVVTSADKTEKKERKPRERKVDTEKVNLIQLIGEFLVTQNLDFVEIVKPEREINFKIGENDYTLTLTKHRKAKK